jgi:UDP-N-acetyl-D-galactosamine dehydrogenase
MDIDRAQIAVIGLGYVGLPLAVEFGKKRSVIGFDIKSDRIYELQNRYDRTLEVSQDDLLAAKGLTFTDDPKSLSQASIFIVTVPTPVDKSNRPDLNPLIRACRIVGNLLKVNDIVIFESTVYPGATEEICVPILAQVSGLVYLTEDYSVCENNQSGFYVAYSPERINPGDKTKRLTNIIKITSGSTPLIAKVVDELYQEIIIAGTHKVTSIKVAEAAKVIENAQRDLNIAFVNELSVIFNLMGIDTSEVLDAAATKWNFMPFKPGLVGGHCIGVDPYYLTYKAQELGYQPQVILSGRRINDNMGRYATQNFIRLMLKSGINVARSTVGLLGITFKENCPDVRNSKAIDIISELERWGLQVKVMDPWANPDEVMGAYGVVLTKITPDNPVDSIIIAVSHNEFACMTSQELKALCASQRLPVIADLKSLYSRDELETQGFCVFRL